jgi:hypothetical protein
MYVFAKTFNLGRIFCNYPRGLVQGRKKGGNLPSTQML